MLGKKQNVSWRRIGLISILLGLLLMVVHCLPHLTQAATKTYRIMPLGDSITEEDTWRTKLFYKLQYNGYNIDFVGSKGNNEGHSRMMVVDLAESDLLTQWLSSSNPDIVIMHFGTDDCWNSIATKDILNAYTKLVQQMRENNPKMIIVVAKLLPLRNYYNTQIQNLNSQISSWAEGLSTKQSPITVADQYTGFDAKADTKDGVIPNSSGGQKMCNVWYEELSRILSNVSDQETEQENPSPVTPSPVTPPPVTPPPPTGDSLSLSTDINEWIGGYTLSLTISNPTDEEVDGWKLILNKSDFSITNIWAADVSEEEANIIITPASWNKIISAGGSISFGFQGMGTLPSNFFYKLEKG